MATIDWPRDRAFMPQGLKWGVNSPGTSWAAPYTGQRQRIGNLAERLTCSFGLGPLNRHAVIEQGRREALLFGLQCSGDLVRLGRPDRPRPLGNLRGVPHLNAAALTGASSVALRGCVNAAQQSFSSFEPDSNADGLADHVVAYSNGSTGTVTYSRTASPVVDGAWAQSINAAALGATGVDRVGIRLDRLGVLSGASQLVTVSAYMRGSASTVGHVVVEYLNEAGTVVESDSDSLALTASYGLINATELVPAGAVSARVFLYITNSSGGALGCGADIDAVQINPGAARTDFEGLPSLLAGDLIAVGSQLLPVGYAGAVANDAGLMTVPLHVPVRDGLANGAAVLWDAPTGVFQLAGLVAPIEYVPGRIQLGPELSFVEHLVA